MGTMSAEPVWELCLSSGKGLVGVDQENKILLGYIVAEAGPFKSKGRGEFDSQSLRMIVEQGNAAKMGLKSRFGHPGMSSDALGTHLGRAKNFRMDGDKIVRADLHLAPASFTSPKGNLGQHVLDMAADDPLAIGSSLVIEPDKKYRLNEDGTRMSGPDQEPLPPLWYPKKLFASDIVDEGDSTNSLLSAQFDVSDPTTEHCRKAWETLNNVFSGQPREVTKSRLLSFVDRYLSHRYGEESRVTTDAIKDKLSRVLGADGIDTV